MNNFFRVIIAGSRDFKDYDTLCEICDFMLKNKLDVEIVSGTAKGADQLGEKYANERGYKLKKFPADWSLGKSAGYIRNELMAKNADALIAFWDGKSKGTNHMINIAKKNNLKTKIHLF
jgi:hypothetical protein